MNGKRESTWLMVHRCHECGKPVTDKLQSLEVIDKITILCEECSDPSIRSYIKKALAAKKEFEGKYTERNL